MADSRRRNTANPYKGHTVKMQAPLPNLDDDASSESTATERSPLEAAVDAGGIQVEVVHVEATPKKPRRGRWRALEVWTKNRVYGVDGAFVCFEVLDRRTGQLEPKHPMLGAKLAGGQVRGKNGMTITEPFPIVDTAAIFTHSGRHACTSAVERVVIRVRSLRARADINWEQLLADGG
jgi:hypothetical protein